MILEAGIAKLLLAGGGAVSSIALLAGMAGGNTPAQAKPNSTTKAAICAYAEEPKAAVRPAAPTPENATTTSLSAPARLADTSKLGLTGRQLANAKIIIKTADKLGLPDRAKLVALAAALQESWLNEKAVGDNSRAHGLFQMWPSHGWGTIKQVTDPRYAARKFYSVLVKVKNWEKLSITQAAQAVERSAYPNAYAKHERLARRIIAALATATTPPATSSRTDPETTARAERPARQAALTKEEEATARADIEAAAALDIDKRELVQHFVDALRAKLHKAAAELRNDPKMDTAAVRKKVAELRRDLRKDSAQIRREAGRLVTTIAARVCAEVTKALPDKTLKKVTGSSAGAIAVRHALDQRGTDYSWGGGNASGASYGIGRGANTKGFDCSGLVEYAWAKAGVRVGGHTSTQWNSGARVARSDLKPGDLVFFAYSPKAPATIHHVGIYIGNGKMVHSPYTGSTVRVASISRPDFAGAVRPGTR